MRLPSTRKAEETNPRYAVLPYGRPDANLLANEPVRAMTIFAVIASTANQRLGEALSAEFPNENMEFAPGQFVVSANHVGSEDLSRKIGIQDGAFGNVVVFTVVGYWGFHSKSLWEWLATRRPS